MRNIAALLGLTAAIAWGTPVTVGGDPRVNPADYRITTFASGLNFPTSMTRLPDGSLLVATTNPPSGVSSAEPAYFSGSGKLLRLVDADNNGVADGPSVEMASFGAAITSVRVLGDLVFVSTLSGDNRVNELHILRMNGSPGTGPYTSLGAITLEYGSAAALTGNTLSLAVRDAGGGNVDVFFALAAGSHDGTPIGTVTMSGLASGTIPPGSLHRVTVQDLGGSIGVGTPALIATGVRVSAGLAFGSGGSLLISDNGYQSYATGDQVSADELHRLSPAQLAAGGLSLGYPNNYTDYGAGAFIGGAGVSPFVAFLPGLAGEARGAAEVVQAPSWMPNGLSAGYLAAFHGTWDVVGADNAINPVYWVDPVSAAYFPIIAAGLPGVGHLDGVFADAQGIFLADLFNVRGFAAGSGAIYMLAPADEAEVPEPPAAGLLLIGGGIVWLARRRAPFALSRRPVRNRTVKPSPTSCRIAS
jgi:hypothetical protein